MGASLFKPNMIKLYYNYFDYIWTNKFLDYNQKSRDKFIKNNFQNLKFDLFYIIIIVILLILIKPIKIIANKRLLFSFLFSKIRFKNNVLNKSLTHQELFKKLSNDEQTKFIDVFNVYEKLNYAKNYRINYKTFFITNYKIMKFYLNT